MLTINHIVNLFKMLKIKILQRNFQKYPLKKPFPLLIGEGVIKPFTELPQLARGNSVLLFENFISAFKTLSFCCELQKRTRKPPGLRLEEAYFGKAKTGREDNDTSVQSQSERDRTVAGNEGGRERTSR